MSDNRWCPVIEEALYFFDENLLDEIKANYGIASTESGADVSNYVNKGTNSFRTLHNAPLNT